MGAVPEGLAARERSRLLPFLPTALLRLPASGQADATALTALIKSSRSALLDPAGMDLHLNPTNEGPRWPKLLWLMEGRCSTMQLLYIGFVYKGAETGVTGNVLSEDVCMIRSDSSRCCCC